MPNIQDRGPFSPLLLAAEGALGVTAARCFRFITDDSTVEERISMAQAITAMGGCFFLFSVDALNRLPTNPMLTLARINLQAISAIFALGGVYFLARGLLLFHNISKDYPDAFLFRVGVTSFASPSPEFGNGQFFLG